MLPYHLLLNVIDLFQEVFTAVAKKLQDSIGFGKASAAIKNILVPGTETESFVVLLSDDDPFVYEGAFTEEDLTAFGLRYKHPLFSELGMLQKTVLIN